MSREELTREQLCEKIQDLQRQLDLKLAELARSETDRLESVGRLAGGVAHEFNNLLTVINGYSELILSRLAPGDRALAMVREVRRAGERAAALTRQLLAFGRKALISPAIHDPNMLIREMETLVRKLAGEQIEIHYQLAPDLGTILVDASQLEMALANLVVNAREAMPNGGKLTIATRNVADEAGSPTGNRTTVPSVLIAVSNTGPALPAAALTHLFEPFYTPGENEPVSGLGLATVYGVVKQVGGQIEVRSHETTGTIFELTFPRVDPATPLASGQLPVTQRETILLAEDEDGVRNLLRLTLQAAGFRVLAARDGQDALQIARTHQGPIHVLITDVTMPGMDGNHLAECLVLSHPELKILYISGYHNISSLLASSRLQRTSFLQKPFTPDRLLRTLRDILDGSNRTVQSGVTRADERRPSP